MKIPVEDLYYQKALLTTKRIELVDEREFTAIALDPESETVIIYVISLSSDGLPSSFPLKLNVHPFRRFQVFSLIVEKALIKVSAKYLDFADVFFPDLVSKRPKYNAINDHTIELTIKLDNGQQPPYWPFYSLGPVELEILKA